MFLSNQIFFKDLASIKFFSGWGGSWGEAKRKESKRIWKCEIAINIHFIFSFGEFNNYLCKVKKFVLCWYYFEYN